ncbi:MAG: NusG domain II-containing protein [Roseburia sp.]
MEKKTGKKDVILIMAILAVALASYFGIRYYQGMNTREAVAVVKVGEAEYGRFPLNADVTEKIELPDGSYNILEIRDGKADITEASCPDGICVDHRPVSRKNETIVCLPNKVVVEIQNGEESDVDSMTN